MIPITRHLAFNIQKVPTLKSYYTKNMLKLRFLGYSSLTFYIIKNELK